MIIQSTLEGKPNFVVEQADHARMSGKLAESLGNDSFSAPVPHDLLNYIVAHHDEGWTSIDALREQSPITGLPHHLTQTPLPLLVKTSKASPEFNEAHHAFCGLLSSMHTYGLFNGRYGMSDFIFIDKIAPDNKQAVTEMLPATSLKDPMCSATALATVGRCTRVNIAMGSHSRSRDANSSLMTTSP